VHKAKRLLEREGLENTKSNDTKVAVKKLSTEITDNNLMDTNK